MQPIFVGGCDRSGTTMLGAMLGAHPDILCVPEAPFLVEAVRRHMSAPGQAVRATDVVDSISRHPRFALWEVDPQEWLRAVNAETTPFSSVIEQLVRVYRSARRGAETSMWVDHTPSNMQHLLQLSAVFPEARFIHILRDGRGVAASIMPLDWGPNGILQAARWWKAKVEAALAREALSTPGSVCRIQYEEVLQDPMLAMRRLSEFLEVPFAEATVNPVGFAVPPYTARQHALVGTRPAAARAVAWKESLSPRELEIFESVAGALLRDLGYEQSYGSEARPPTVPERLQSRWREAFRGATVNAVRLRRRERLLTRH